MWIRVVCCCDPALAGLLTWCRWPGPGSLWRTMELINFRWAVNLRNNRYRFIAIAGMGNTQLYSGAQVSRHSYIIAESIPESTVLPLCLACCLLLLIFPNLFVSLFWPGVEVVWPHQGSSRGNQTPDQHQSASQYLGGCVSVMRGLLWPMMPAPGHMRWRLLTRARHMVIIIPVWVAPA